VFKALPAPDHNVQPKEKHIMATETVSPRDPGDFGLSAATLQLKPGAQRQWLSAYPPATRAATRPPFHRA
jgi:hypothetical protein